MRDSDAVLAAMRRAGVPLTLDWWLAFNMVPVGELLSAELREIVPDVLRAEFDSRFAMQVEFETRFRGVALWNKVVFPTGHKLQPFENFAKPINEPPHTSQPVPPEVMPEYE